MTGSSFIFLYFSSIGISELEHDTTKSVLSEKSSLNFLSKLTIVTGYSSLISQAS